MGLTCVVGCETVGYADGLNIERISLYVEQLSLSCTVTSWPMTSIGWLVTAFVELILFIMLLIKSLRVEREGIAVPSTANSNIITVIANDSKTYFAMYAVRILRIWCLV